MTIEHKTNFILITDIVDNQFIKVKYIGYTEKQAIKMFKEKESKWKQKKKSQYVAYVKKKYSQMQMGGTGQIMPTQSMMVGAVISAMIR